MQYSVYRFIEEDLNTTTNKFVKKIGSKQSTYSTWKSRNRSVNELPIQLLVDLVAESGLSHEQVIKKLMKYEIDYETAKAGIDLNG